MSEGLPARLGAIRQTYAPGVRFDRGGLGLIAVMLAIQGCALWLVGALELTAPAPEQQPPPEFGLLFVGELVLVSLLLIGAYRLWKRVPDRWQSRIRSVVYGLFYGVVFLIGIVFAGLFVTVLAFASATVVTYAVYKMDTGTFSWIAHNIVAFALAVIVVTLFGAGLGPNLIVIFLLGTLAWDYVAVMKTGWMEEIVELSGGSLPNYFIIPGGWPIDYDAVTDWLDDPDDDPPENVAGVIGSGDFILPSALVLSLAVREGVFASVTIAAAVGVVVALGVLRAAMANVDSALPALPWVNSGAIGGYVIAAGLVTVVGETVVVLA